MCLRLGRGFFVVASRDDFARNRIKLADKLAFGTRLFFLFIPIRLILISIGDTCFLIGLVDDVHVHFLFSPYIIMCNDEKSSVNFSQGNRMKKMEGYLCRSCFTLRVT